MADLLANSTDFVNTARYGDGKTASRQPYQIAVTAVFLSLSIPAVALRIWIRRWMINSLGWDDYMMVVALVCPLLRNRQQRWMVVAFWLRERPLFPACICLSNVNELLTAVAQLPHVQRSFDVHRCRWRRHSYPDIQRRPDRITCTLRRQHLGHVLTPAVDGN
jgi:hypothetical protein